MSKETRVAAIDIGTNSVLLAIAQGNDEPRPILELATITRLGRQVAKTGRLSESACRETLDCLARYAERLAEHSVVRVAAVCTSAVRDAANGHEFVTRAEATLGVRPQVIDGLEEAQLTFAGALSGLRLRGPVLVVDIGGGSTELIRGIAEQERKIPEQSCSLAIGSVRLTEAHLCHDPPLPEELTRLREAVREALATAPVEPKEAPFLVGVAGTVTTLVAVDRRLSRYDHAAVHGARLGCEPLEALAKRLASLPLTSRLALPGLVQGRADIIVAGGFIALEIVRWAGTGHLIASDRGVRWGLIQRLLASG